VDESLEEILARFDPEVRDLGGTDQVPDRRGLPRSGRGAVAPTERGRLRRGPKKVSEHFCYIAFHKDHVNLGFNQGAELPDPAALLEGPGKTLRHTKITGPENLAQPALRKLVDAAVSHRLTTRPGG
jgi:hypothetical protein